MAAKDITDVSQYAAIFIPGQTRMTCMLMNLHVRLSSVMEDVIELNRSLACNGQHVRAGGHGIAADGPNNPVLQKLLVRRLAVF